jgi:regulator of protease activity HflC (stomatin/prohibitin superfamily)
LGTRINTNNCTSPFKQIQQGCVGLVTKFGRFIRAVDPGLYKINPFCEDVIMIDVRTKVEDIPRQMALTKDNVSVNIDSVLCMYPWLLFK